MAKNVGLVGSISGRIGNVVMASVKGVQITRAYQPNVANPSTEKQVQARAKLKLLSQLAAVLAPAIAIPSIKNVSRRNLFIRKNYATATYANNMAQIVAANVKLTNSALRLPTVSIVRADNRINVSLAATTYLEVSRVVYVLVRKYASGAYSLDGLQVVEVAGSGNSYPYSFTSENVSSEFVVYAYGIRDNTTYATTVYGNMRSLPSEEYLKLAVTRLITTSDVSLTETNGAVLLAAS